MLWEDGWLYMLVSLCLKQKRLPKKVLLRLYREVSLQPVTCTPGEDTESRRSRGGRSSVSSWEVRHIFHYWASRDFTVSLKTVNTSQKVLYLRWEMVCNGVWKILPNDKQSGLQEVRGRRLVARALKRRLVWISVDQYVQTVLSVLSHQLKWCMISLTDRRKTINYVDFMVCFLATPLKNHFERNSATCAAWCTNYVA